MPCPCSSGNKQRKGRGLLSSERKNSTFFGGVAILAVGVVVVKLIGALYKIPLANILGEEGNGYFMSAYSIYSVLLTISTGGLPVALSKSVSEAHALGRVNQERQVFRVAFFSFFVLGALSCLIMVFGSGPITELQGNSGARYAALTLAPAAFFVCCVSSIRGYAQGQGNMVPTSVSQIIEALGKLIIGLACAYLFGKYANVVSGFPGYRGGEPLQLAAAGAILGVTVGTALSLAYLFFSHTRRARADRRKGSDQPESEGAILKRLITFAVPITISASVVPIVNFIDSAIVQNRLQDALLLAEKEASSLYGNYSAVTNLYALPSALIAPFTAALIPAISAAMARKQEREAARVSESALRIAMLLACPMGFGLSALSTPIVRMLYPGYRAEVAGPILMILGVTSIATCVMLLCNAILQASGFVNLPILVITVGGILKLVVNYVLVGMESINVVGAAVGTACCFGTAALLDLLLLRRAMPAPPSYRRVFVKPLIASVVMGLGAWALQGLFAPILGNTLSTLFGVMAGVVIYLALVLALRAISKEDLSLMPKGDKIAKILKIQ